MSKIRVFELAEELHIPAEKLVEALRDLNLNISNPMSVIDMQVAGIIREVIKKQRKRKSAESPKEANRDLSPVPTPATPPQDEPKAATPDVTSPAKPVTTGIPDKTKPKSDTQPEKSRDKRFKDDEAVVDRKIQQGRGKNRQDNRKGAQSFHPTQHREQQSSKVVVVENAMTVGEFSKASGRTVAEIIKKLLELGFMANINQQLDIDSMEIVANELGITLEIRQVKVDAATREDDIDLPESLQPRYPVVTVMGHVDHGKTSLLDVIRHTNVTASEAGGITQHIGAYQVDVGDKKVVFLDTPGHEAFTQMRARGAKATDLAILVVAADDGVMPQTVEALNHAKAAQVPIIVAVNKMDKPGANPDRVKQQLTEYGIVAEEWGGDTIFVGVSALQREGIDELLTSILTVAEVMELKANPDRPAVGVVIEAEVDKGKGPLATVLVQKGTLNIGDAVVAGSAYGKVRAMVSDKGKRLKKAGPSTPIELQGLSSAPQAGDELRVVKDDKTARAMAESAMDARRAKEQKQTPRVHLDDFFQQINTGESKELRLIIKGDVQGSVEALRPSVEKLSNAEVDVKVIHTGVGPVNESDIMLAQASAAIIIAFNVRAEPNARRVSEQEQVDVRYYRIIYEVIDDITKALTGMLAPVFKEVVIGQAEVRVVFKITGSGVIAGSYVTEGKITRQAGVRLLRGGVVIYEGKIGSLKRFKEDAREVAMGYECGISLDNYEDMKEGDVVEAFIKEQVQRS
ncbi:MAG: translation initiation factor IF-2 [Peptococcaceae bacterium]|nr:translation initiation factor IF-2 [Peptococcaceae bacterium]